MKNNHETILKCASMVEKAESVAVLSGAGVSTSSGIPDFRGPNGIYRRKYDVDPEMIFDIDFFSRDPSFFYKFHREFLEALEEVSPSYTHKFLAALEREGRLKGIVTQNIDALHHKAGSQKVLEIHGGVWKSTCLSCGKSYDYETSRRKTMDEDIPRCEICGGVIKPDIVFFGENVKHLEASRSIISQADLLFVLGSSLTVVPAALLPSCCTGRIVVVNKGEVSGAYLPPDRIDLRVEGDLDEFFRGLNEKLNLTIQ
ncbi:Sir2 family NAD-dependent protein deacetylase [Dethiosulfovibrio sp. F2B]|uniref:SIR2 family NAD-dependent protein deacylase n=1 Tax=Dethiosulfovibrio faecalis TaxID=2720018 RepID=UPI001F2D5C01|nr:Sir2 family NAD-dependent protein deacetylase [Dethiosulfovibrio faecalis]MCF4151996.1 Sir2 family NAD-dependent protein deacetylase [Dethiosulfovibrio faecalis]